jgi:hypothetical protein
MQGEHKAKIAFLCRCELIKKVKIIAMVNDEWQYQPLNLGDGLPENLLEGMYAKTDKQQPWMWDMFTCPCVCPCSAPERKTQV